MNVSRLPEKKPSSVALSAMVEERQSPGSALKVFAKPEIINFQTILEKINYESKAASAEVLILLNTLGLNIVTVESLTAGKIASTLADIPSYAASIYGGFVVYDSDAKREFVNVTVKSVYNQKCAKQMAEGALNKSRAMCALAVTGQAGGYDDTDDVYLGYVDMAFSIRSLTGFQTTTRRIKFCDDKHIEPICDEYKKRLTILHKNKACPDLGTLPLSDDLYQIRQIIRTACVRDALLFAYEILRSLPQDYCSKLEHQIFYIKDRDIALKNCGEPSKFIKKYMKGDLSIFDNPQYPNLFGDSGDESDTKYNDYCDQKDWNSGETTISSTVSSNQQNSSVGGFLNKKKLSKKQKRISKLSKKSRK